MFYIGIVFAFLVRPLAAEQIQVMGTTISVEAVEHYATGAQPISDFVVSRPLTLSLARGNSFTAYSLVYLHENGNISLVISDRSQILDWTTSDGRHIRLDCGQYSSLYGVSNRPVRFYPDGEYQDGCSLLEPTLLMSPGGVQVQARAGRLEVDRDFHVLYAEHVESTEVKIGQFPIKTLAGESLSFYPDGGLNFLTPERGQTFTQVNPRYGPLQFMSPFSFDAALTFFANGNLRRGILAQSLAANSWRPEVSSGAGVEFDENGEIEHIVFREPVEITVCGLKILAREWDRIDYKRRVAIAGEMDLQLPQGTLHVPVGSILTFAPNGEIAQVQIPEKAL